LFVISIITDAELLNCFGVIRISASYLLTSRTQLGLIYYALIVGFFFPFFFTHVKMESKAGLEDFFCTLVVMAPHL
jgi:hypothetical protein